MLICGRGVLVKEKVIMGGLWWCSVLDWDFKKRLFVKQDWHLWEPHWKRLSGRLSLYNFTCSKVCESCSDQELPFFEMRKNLSFVPVFKLHFSWHRDSFIILRLLLAKEFLRRLWRVLIEQIWLKSLLRFTQWKLSFESLGSSWGTFQELKPFWANFGD